MNYAQILALPVNANPRLIHASDNGNYYVMQAATAGSTATVMGNAVVPNDAPIQPAQAFVDNIALFVPDYASPANAILDLSNKGITKIDDIICARFAVAIGNNGIGPAQFNFSGNALPSDQIEALLSTLAAVLAGGGGTLNISGGTNAVPLVNVQEAVRITGTTDLTATSFVMNQTGVNGKNEYNKIGTNLYITWDGAQWIIDDQSGTYYTSPDDTPTPDLATFGAGAGGTPIVHPWNKNRTILETTDAFWTVITN